MSNNKEKDEEKPIVAKTAVDLQRLKLMKLMKNPDKPIILPERPKPKNTPTVPEFVRNVMGSSAGAGSGEFHVYRHLRRKEYARQKFIQEKGHKELLDAEYHEKLEQNKRQAEEATAKKRAKRLKRKQKMKERKKMKLTNTVKNNKENNDTQHSDAEDSDATEEINKNNIQSDTNGTTPMEIEQLKVEDKERMEVEDNDKGCRENNENCVQPDITGDKDVTNSTPSTGVEQMKEMESKEKNEVKCREEKEKNEAECKEKEKNEAECKEKEKNGTECKEKEKNEADCKEEKEKNEAECKEESQKESEVEHEEGYKNNEVEHKEGKEKSELGDKESKKGETEQKEEHKENDTTNMVSTESMDKETKEDK